MDTRQKESDHFSIVYAIGIVCIANILDASEFLQISSDTTPVDSICTVVAGIKNIIHN